MSGVVRVSTQNIEAASQGDATALRSVLQTIADSVAQQQDVAATSPQSIPAQATFTVGYSGGTFAVSIINPSFSGSLTTTQAQQLRAQGIDPVLNAVRPIYHQLRCASAITFDDSSSVQTFGGDTGSVQVHWAIPGITQAAAQYWQVRSSYDGANWNAWKTSNGGSPLTRTGVGVTLESATNMDWAIFKLRGSQQVAFGAGTSRDGGTFKVPAALYTSAMQAISGPNGFDAPEGQHFAHGFLSNEVDILVPTNPVPLSGPADYPVSLLAQYQDGEGTKWSQHLNLFGIAFDPDGENVTQYVASTGNWAVFKLAGGAQLAIGSGTVADGGALVLPAALAWVSPAHALKLLTPRNGISDSHQAHGIYSATFGATDFIANCKFGDGSGNQWSATANWLVIAWSPGLPEIATSNGKFVAFDTPDGTRLAVGLAKFNSGDALVLPSGFTLNQSLGIAVPVGFNDAGNAMYGVGLCDVEYGVGRLQYTDGSGNTWGGAMAWMGFMWQ